MIFIVRPDGGIGRRAGLKIQFPQGSVGSTPSPGTIQLRSWRAFDFTNGGPYDLFLLASLISKNA